MKFNKQFFTTRSTDRNQIYRGRASVLLLLCCSLIILLMMIGISQPIAAQGGAPPILCQSTAGSSAPTFMPVAPNSNPMPTTSSGSSEDDTIACPMPAVAAVQSNTPSTLYTPIPTTGLATLSPLALSVNIAANQVVTRLDDTNRGVCAVRDCSLREAVTTASAGDKVTFAPALFTSTLQQTLALTPRELVINDSLTIVGPGADKLVISGSGIDRIFLINGGTVNISGLSLTGGVDLTGGNHGGAIYIYQGTVTLTSLAIFGNNANGGGGIWNGGTLKIDRSSIYNNDLGLNSAGEGGGGIENDFIGGTSGDSIIIVNTTLYNNGTGRLTRGGALYNAHIHGTATLYNSTIANNSASIGGGLMNNGGVVTIANTILANNLTNDCNGNITDGSPGHNLIVNDSSCSFNTQTSAIQPSAVLLGPPGNVNFGAFGRGFGGTTDVLSINIPSAAIGNGDIKISQALPVNGVDQRGYKRAASTIGAFDPYASSQINQQCPFNGTLVKVDTCEYTYSRNMAVTYALHYSNNACSLFCALNFYFVYPTQQEQTTYACTTGGTDCANFVSQGLFYGGFPMTPDWYCFINPYNLCERGQATGGYWAGAGTGYKTSQKGLPYYLKSKPIQGYDTHFLYLGTNKPTLNTCTPFNGVQSVAESAFPPDAFSQNLIVMNVGLESEIINAWNDCDSTLESSDSTKSIGYGDLMYSDSQGNHSRPKNVPPFQHVAIVVGWGPYFENWAQLKNYIQMNKGFIPAQNRFSLVCGVQTVLCAAMAVKKW